MLQHQLLQIQSTFDRYIPNERETRSTDAIVVGVGRWYRVYFNEA